MESSDRKVIIFPGDQNSPVNLGSFEELVFARDPKNKLEFNFEWSLANPHTIKDPLSKLYMLRRPPPLLCRRRHGRGKASQARRGPA